MTTWIIFALGIFFVQTLLPPAFRYILGPNANLLATLGSRDNPPETSVLGARSERALRNTIEGLLIFSPLALLHEDSGTGLLGAKIFVLSRFVYVPVYIAGIPVLRSVVWTVGVVGLGMMALGLLGR